MIIISPEDTTRTLAVPVASRLQGEKILSTRLLPSKKHSKVVLNYVGYIIEAINHFYCDLRFVMFHFLLVPNAGPSSNNKH